MFWIGSPRRFAQTAFAIAMALLFVLAPLICIRVCELRAIVAPTRDVHAGHTHGHAHARSASEINHAAHDTTGHDAARAPAPMEELQRMLLTLIELIVPVLIIAHARHSIRQVAVHPLTVCSLPLPPPRARPRGYLYR